MSRNLVLLSQASPHYTAGQGGWWHQPHTHFSVQWKDKCWDNVVLRQINGCDVTKVITSLITCLPLYAILNSCLLPPIYFLSVLLLSLHVYPPAPLIRSPHFTTSSPNTTTSSLSTLTHPTLVHHSSVATIITVSLPFLHSFPRLPSRHPSPLTTHHQTSWPSGEIPHLTHSPLPSWPPLFTALTNPFSPRSCP